MQRNTLQPGKKRYPGEMINDMERASHMIWTNLNEKDTPSLQDSGYHGIQMGQGMLNAGTRVSI